MIEYVLEYLSSLWPDAGLALLAFAFAFPLAWERHKADRPAGLRTFPIVALASCAFVVLGQRAFEGSPDAQARVFQGLMTGIGFIGGGAILKERGGSGEGGPVQGIATAASIWNTGAIGAAVAFRRFDVAVILSVLNFAILRFLRPSHQEEEVQES